MERYIIYCINIIESLFDNFDYSNVDLEKEDGKLESLHENIVKRIDLSSTSMQVLVVSMSALRAIAIINTIKKSNPNTKSLKLFSKHIKVYLLLNICIVD
jgi:hypothetical protein